MDINLRVYEDATVTLKSRGREVTKNVYSAEGIELIDTVSLKQAAQFKRMYNFSWLGVKIIQFPLDVLCVQQLIAKVRPTLIIETGIAHGGSLIFSASMLKLLDIDGRVFGVDVDIRNHNREIIEHHPLNEYITMLEGNSISDEIISSLRNEIRQNDRVLVILDSNHSYEHVRAELDLYSDFVSQGSYLIAMDGALGFVGDIPRGNEQAFIDNPVPAIRQFLTNNADFVLDSIFEDNGTTSSPYGALYRQKK